jgi:chromosome partitioning protein
MTGAVVSIAQQKGSAGKTTLAIQLGIAWPTMGRRAGYLWVAVRDKLLV